MYTTCHPSCSIREFGKKNSDAGSKVQGERWIQIRARQSASRDGWKYCFPKKYTFCLWSIICVSCEHCTFLFMYLFKMILFKLWQNTYSINFTILTMFKCTVQWREVHSHFSTTITTIHLQNFSFSPNETMYPLNSNSPFSPLLSPAPGDPHFTFCLYDFDYSRYLINHWNPIVSVLLWLAYFI